MSPSPTRCYPQVFSAPTCTAPTCIAPTCTASTCTAAACTSSVCTAPTCTAALRFSQWRRPHHPGRPPPRPGTRRPCSTWQLSRSTPTTRSCAAPTAAASSRCVRYSTIRLAVQLPVHWHAVQFAVHEQRHGVQYLWYIGSGKAHYGMLHIVWCSMGYCFTAACAA